MSRTQLKDGLDDFTRFDCLELDYHIDVTFKSIRREGVQKVPKAKNKLNERFSTCLAGPSLLL
jgi:hypothetical protein